MWLGKKGHKNHKMSFLPPKMWDTALSKANRGMGLEKYRAVKNTFR